MYRNPNFPKVYITAEVHPQFSGDMDRLKTVIQQCKLGGADAVKVQLYDSVKLFGNHDRDYVSINKAEFREIHDYCQMLDIDFYASIFNHEYIDWCEELGIDKYKLASRTVTDDPDLCKAVIATGKPVFISLGAWDWENQGMPYEGENITNFYCVAKYPTMLSEVSMPSFNEKGFLGYSDHTVGVGAALYAIARGAKYIEKHYSLNKSLHFPTEMGHMGSMDFEDLSKLRKYADDFSILSANSAKD